MTDSARPEWHPLSLGEGSGAGASSPQPWPAQAGADSFLDHSALELSEDAQYLKHGLALRRGRVEVLLMQEKVDPIA
jgi:hypothetical protein